MFNIFKKKTTQETDIQRQIREAREGMNELADSMAAEIKQQMRLLGKLEELNTCLKEIDKKARA